MSTAIDRSAADARTIADRARRALQLVDTPGAVRHLEGVRDEAERLALRIERMSLTANAAFHEANP